MSSETTVLALNLHLGDRVRLASGQEGEVTGMVANDLPVIDFIDGRPHSTTRKTVMLLNLDGNTSWVAVSPTEEVWVPAPFSEKDKLYGPRSGGHARRHNRSRG